MPGIRIVESVAKERATILPKNITENFINKKTKEYEKIGICEGPEITQRNNEIKDTIKVISSLENTGFLWKKSSRNIISEGEFLSFLWPWMSVGLPLIKNVLTLLAKRILIRLWLTAVASAANADTQIFFFGLARTLPIISNKKMEDIIKTVEALEKSGLLIKGVTETIKTKK